MLTQGQGAARLIGGSTAKTLAEGFITIQTAGIRELAERLEMLANKAGDPRALERIVKEAGKIIEKGYKANVADVTGNLRKSTKVRTKVYESAAVAIVGPLQTGNRGATEKQASGNAAWLNEFGSGPRRPGTEGRRTYINVHQMINRKMTRHSSMNDEQFANQARGYYFLMGSINEPTRQARMGKGYPHDFGVTNGKMHPVTLHPGETYGAMPASHAMERTIESKQQQVYSFLETAIRNSIKELES